MDIEILSTLREPDIMHANDDLAAMERTISAKAVVGARCRMSAGGESGPAAFLAALEARATRVETPCGDGVMIWRIWGEGKPLVLGHGAQGSWTHWARNIDSIARHRRLIVANLPGNGDSALPETPDHRGISRALVTGLREILGDALPVDICGFSFGVVVFSHMAAFHPGVARRLVLVACGGLGTPQGQPDLPRVSGLVGEQRTAALQGEPAWLDAASSRKRRRSSRSCPKSPARSMQSGANSTGRTRTRWCRRKRCARRSPRLASRWLRVPVTG